jgi:hypothetical protein
MPAEIEPRTEKSCSNPVALPIGETFRPHNTIVMYSPAFHAAIGRTITVKVGAEMSETSSNPANGTVGVSLHQCCDVLDELHTAQVVGHIGPTGSPEFTQTMATLRDECTLTTHHDGDCVYYLRLKIASSSDPVRLSYTVS